MGIYERREREKYERRSLILETAKKLILELGVDALTMQDIANACELSKGALYLYFENKEALLEELFNVACSYFVEYVAEKTEPEATGLEALRTLWLSYIELFGEASDVIVLFGVKNALSSQIFLGDETMSEKEKKENTAYQLLSLFEKILSKGVKDKTLDSSIDPKKVARTIVFMAEGIVQNIAKLPSTMRNDRLILEEMQTTFEIVLRGLASRNSDPSLLILPLD